MKTYHWDILSENSPKNESEIIDTLLVNRGVKTKKEIEQFFSPQNPLDISPESVGISAKELDSAVDRIKKAIDRKEKIIVYGDYDADGITATAILWETLRDLGANVLPYIPDRVSEGYGLNEDSITKLKTDDPELKLIVTVDHGIVSHKKIDFAVELGVDVIVTDHHQPTADMPKAFAVVHTTSLSGSGVAWMLAKELSQVTSDKSLIQGRLELVALGTIADLIPLTGPNRSLVKSGLNEINHTKRPGLKALMEIARIDPAQVGSYEVGYMITPRLNAMGRLEHAIESLRLLCTHDLNRAKSLALTLDLTNRDRQQMTQETVLHARQLLLAKQKGQLSPLIFIAHESYEQGIIGLVAGKLVEEFYLPAIVISKGDKFSKASARSISGFNIIESIRTASDLLVDAGGHPMAAGFTVETSKLSLLEERLTEVASASLTDKSPERSLKIDLELDLSQVNESLAEKIKTFAPFGQGNPEPTFVSRGVQIVSSRPVGGENQHLKLTLKKDNLEAIAFRMGELQQELSPNKPIDIAYCLEINEWNGNKRVQLRIKDIQFPKK